MDRSGQVSGVHDPALLNRGAACAPEGSQPDDLSSLSDAGASVPSGSSCFITVPTDCPESQRADPNKSPRSIM